MSGYPNQQQPHQDYDDGYGHPHEQQHGGNTDSYYQDDQYYDQHGAHDAQGHGHQGEGYYDESYV